MRMQCVACCSLVGLRAGAVVCWRKLSSWRNLSLPDALLQGLQTDGLQQHWEDGIVIRCSLSVIALNALAHTHTHTYTHERARTHTRP